MQNPNTIDEVLAAEVFPNLPAVAVKVLALESKASSAEVARVIARDASLSARLLKVANSPLYAPASPVGNIKRAITILGNRQVRTLSLAFSLIPLQNSLLDYSRFWQHSLAVAIGTRRLLELANSRLANDGFTAGLLADIGMILLAGAQPAKYRVVIKGCVNQKIRIEEAEREIFGFDHAELGAAAARHWNFPESFQAVMAYHHDPQAFIGNEETLLLVHVVHLAGLLADVFYSERPEIIHDKFQQAVESVPLLNPFSFGGLAEAVEEETREISAWMGIHLDHKPIAEILEEANKRLVGISAEYEDAIEWLYRTQVGKIQLAKDPDEP